MSGRVRVSHPLYNLLPTSIEGFDSLAELALNVSWSWNRAADELWRRLDERLWKATHNPWVVLQTVSRSVIESALADPVYREKLNSLLEANRQHAHADAWFQQHHPNSALSCAAYLSMEFMLSEALPIYSGGLGNVAGDQLKAASDLGVPIIGVGLLFQQGYFRQMIDRNGDQQALFPFNDPGQLPITPLRDANGEWLRVQTTLPGYSLSVRGWQVQIGRRKLYLLDSNDPANYPAHRGITSELYGGGPELRLQQELILGICGWRILRALGLQPQVCHLNEGHAAFAVLERARDFMQQTGQPFEATLAATRAGNLFTTHTAVAAGFDLFSPALIEQYLTHYAEERLGIPIEQLLALGRKDADDASEPFNMAYLALRGSGAVNAVSRLHAEVSRRIFQPLFPRWPQGNIPIRYITNGVHVPTWASEESNDLWTEMCGQHRWAGGGECDEAQIQQAAPARLWQLRNQERAVLVAYARERLAGILASSGSAPDKVETARHLFDPNILTLGFARRFATYKRPNLLLRDRERLLRLLSNPERPVQLIIAGKAHPQDQQGQELIREWVQFIRQPEVRPHIMFLSDYDMLLTENLVHGVDLWINNPRRPWEACGTSGMKVLVNGGLNLSELDGWWAEAYTPEVGWALGDGKEHDDDPTWDASEADALYTLLESEVVPDFYTRDENGVPLRWIQRMRASMAQLTPRFSASRAVIEYTEQHYVPAAAAYRERAANHGAVGAEMAEWQRNVEREWDELRFGKLRVSTTAALHHFEVEVFLNSLDPIAARVELYAEAHNGTGSVQAQMSFDRDLGGGWRLYRASVPATRPAEEFTARLIPQFSGAANPFDSAKILWQR